MSTSVRALSALLLLAVACVEAELPNEGAPENQAMITSADLSTLYVAGGDDNFVSRVDADSLEAVTTRLEGEPTRLTRIGPRVFATLRAKRAVVELEEGEIRLREVRRVEVGPEPYGIVAASNGSRIYVAVSTANEVRELDGETLETLRTFEVPGEPRWLALHPSNRMLYVGATALGGLYTINLEHGARTKVSFPQVTVAVEGRLQSLPIRVTGDPAVSPDGSHLAVPMVLLNNATPISEGGSIGGVPSGGYLGDGGRTLGPVTPVVAILPTGESGSPQTVEPELVPAAVNGATGYLASVAFSPNGTRIFGTAEGGSAIVVLSTRHDARRDGSARTSGLSIRRLNVYEAPEGARAVVFTTSNRAMVYGFLSRRINAFAFSDYGTQQEIRLYGDEWTTALSTSSRTEAVDRGRALFFATNDPAVSAGGVSCATCHFEGRTDGVTWSFPRGPRQTPSLSGVVSSRAPVGWDAGRETVADDAIQTSTALMGGQMTSADAEAIAAFVDETRAVDHPLRGSSSAQIERGREIFGRPEVGCGGCHLGALFTDKRTYDMLGFDGVKTPSLLGVVTTPPYFHDGSAETLYDVLRVARTGAMGNTSSLDETEMAAL